MTKIADDITRLEQGSQPAPDKIHKLRNALLQLQSIKAESLAAMQRLSVRIHAAQTPPLLERNVDGMQSSAILREGVNHPCVPFNRWA